MPPRLPILLAAATSALVFAGPVHASVTAAELDAQVDRNLDALYAHHLPWGGFHDPLTGGPQFNYGAVALAWLGGERLPERRAAAALTLRYGTKAKLPGAFQVWLEAEAFNSAWLDEQTRALLADHLRAYSTPAVGARALPCQRRADCYNNLKLVDAVASLALVRTGLTSPLPGTRLADPPATERAARRFLGTRLLAAQRPDARITGADTAAVLSDPSRNPLAYHALSTAMLMRAVRLGAPSGARTAARRALWALVGLADPRGTVAWMGRGQEHTWTYAATVYAALAGAAAFADDAALAARLRRLAHLAVAELGAREGKLGFAVVGGPPRASLAGADKSQNTVVCNGLTLAFLHLAVSEAAPGPMEPLPSEVPGSTAVDPTAAGVAAVRGAHTWFAVHRAATHPRDARYDVGLLMAQMLVGDTWRQVVGQRPNTDKGTRLPTSGPVLLRGGRALLPAGRLTARAGSIVLSGAWSGGGDRVSATWRYTATRRGVTLRTPCPAGARLRMIEWAPEARPHARGLVLPGRVLDFSAPVRARRLAGRFASASHERLIGMRLETRCRGRAVTIAWRHA